MSVLIEGVKKPKFCYAVIDGEPEYCPFVNMDSDCILLLEKGISGRTWTWEDQYRKCPLEEAPEPCEDAVSRQAAIDAIGKVSDELYENIKKGATFPQRQWFDGMAQAQSILENLPSTQPEQRWIPCSERLPEEGHDVLITKEPLKIKGYEQEVIKAKRSVDPRSGKIEWWSEFGALTNKAVLAWMPLPEPYKEGEK